MISPKLFDLVRCPDCAGQLIAAAAPPAGGGSLKCASCGRVFGVSGAVLDLRPREAFTEQTKYLDETLHQDARHESIAPPLLGSKIRNDMRRRFLRLGPGDRALDLGCGSGRALAWSADAGAELTGVDIAPYFAPEALARFDLILADLRRLPLRDGAFTKAWSLDVLEHLSRPALIGMLAEANRVLADGGTLFVYTHVRKNGWLAVGVRAVNGFARLCERLGLLDLRQERLRKSDHVNPLRDHEDLAAVVARAGFRLERVTYYTPIIGAFVENVLVRIGERWLVRRARVTAAGDDAVRRARAEAQARVRERGATYAALRFLSAMMRLDVVLFGRFRSGPFFALLRKVGPPAPPADAGGGAPR